MRASYVIETSNSEEIFLVASVTGRLSGGKVRGQGHQVTKFKQVKCGEA